MANSRSENAVFNITTGIITQIGILLLSFIGRRIFVHYLSLDYLGINGLYSNILSVLSLAELGIGNVTQFFLYKPVAEDNKPLIAYLTNYFGKLYRVIAAVILSLGLLLIPILDYIVNSDLEHNELIIYYVIFLLNSVISYFSAHKVSLLAAYQDNRLQKYITLFTNVFAQFAYMAVLIIWHDYVFYVSVTLIMTIVNVILINVLCNRRYPFLKKNIIEKPVEFDRSYIINNIKSTFFYKVGATIVNNTDNILISIMIGIASVGLYSNYCMVVNAIQGFITIITQSLISGIGNLSVTKDKERMYAVFNMMLLLYHFIAAYGGICFFFLFKQLIPIWLGNQYLLDTATTFAIAFSFYLTNAISPIWMFRESNGLFDKVRYLFLTTATANVVLSVILGHWFGIFGILFATSIARIVTLVWYEPHVLFKNLFDSSSIGYWKMQIKNFIASAISFIICLAVNYVMLHGVIGMITKAVLFLLVSIAVFWLTNKNSDAFSKLIIMCKDTARQIKLKNCNDKEKS